MNCRPQLKYVFCFSRDFYLEKYVPLFKYLNNFGIIPPVLAGEESIDKTLIDYGVSFNLAIV